MKKVLLVLSLITVFAAAPAEARHHRRDGHSHSNRQYRNTVGRDVRSLTRHTFGGFASGSSSLCRDGATSHSKHRGGTCSHHGGVPR